MLKFSLSVFLLTLFTLANAQFLPYNQTPDWESNALGRISTGLGLADINGDGWKDMIVADGNDIERQLLTVYYNNGTGNFNSSPDWTSGDIDYHGHLSAGDLNNDGWIDIAVSVYIGEAGFSEPGKLKVYYNQGGELESTPSFVSMPIYTFSCALGDADADGDLDIAAVCGEPYGGVLDYGRVFLNDNGQFSNSNIWISDIEMGSLDVEFGDVDGNGHLDLVYVCEGTSNVIYFSDEQGNISTTAGWQSTDLGNYINSVDIGYNTLSDEYSTYICMTGNNQLGGDGRVKQYMFDNTPYNLTPSWTSNPFGYGSGIFLYDADANGTTDLIYGGWWKPMKIALADGSGFELNPSYTSSTNSVIEAIQVSDLGEESYQFKTFETSNFGSVIQLPEQVVEEVIEVRIDDVVLSSNYWKHIPGKSWICIDAIGQAGQLAEVDYYTSPHGDIVITNWDSGKGNYIFYNTSAPLGINDNKGISTTFDVQVYPNPVDDLMVLECNFAGNYEYEIFDVARNLMDKGSFEGKTLRLSTNHYQAGVYILQVKNKGHIVTKRIIHL